MKINLLEILKKYDSIRINQHANTWQEAINVCLQPLIDKNVVTYEYYEAIIKRTNEWGPYYIISDGLAMPHAESQAGVNDNGFSLVVLDEPVKFDGDSREIRVLIALAATSPEIHTSEALPQIVAIFENEEILKQIMNAKTKEQIISIIEKIDFTKYISN